MLQTQFTSEVPSLPPSQMVSLETSKCISEPISSPRISFSAEFFDDNNFISICPNRPEPQAERAATKAEEDIRNKNITRPTRNPDFEFLSGNLTNMMTADELFSEGKLLPFWQAQHAEKLSKISLKTENPEDGPHETEQNNKDERISWFMDDDPSPRPPKCTVLWKELLRLRKQRGSTLSPSSSSSSSSSSSGTSLTENPSGDHEKKDANREKIVKRVKKGLERTRSASIRIRPVINVPICTPGKYSSVLPPLFPLRRGRLDS